MKLLSRRALIRRIAIDVNTTFCDERWSTTVTYCMCDHEGRLDTLLMTRYDQAAAFYCFLPVII
jgi:hypothetical protein